MRSLLWTLLLSCPLALAQRAPAMQDAPPLADAAVLELPAIDVDKALAEDRARAKDAPGPARYAIGHAIDAVALQPGKSRGGRWSTLADGRLQWQLELRAPGAVSLDLGFRRFRLPAGAELWIRNPDTGVTQGPFTDADNPAQGQFWTPLLRGDTARLELRLPAAKRDFLQLELDTVHHGYKYLPGDSDATKSGSCNVDVVCPEGDNWRDEIRSVAVLSFSATGSRDGNYCSGQFVNSTAPTSGPLFLSANHCDIDGASARVYFNFQNSTCRAPGSAASGQLGDGVLNLSLFGATVLARPGPSLGQIVSSDFELLRFNAPVPAAANVYFSGWDRRDLTPDGVTAIHHPDRDEKRISFDNDPLSVSAYLQNTGSGITHLRVADWDLGTTEPGSSGSGIWNDAGHLVGILSGGEAACGNDLPDWYGRLAHAWEGLGTPDKRLRDWLDNGNTAAQTLEGRNAGCSFALALDSAAFASAPSAGSNVTLSATPSGHSGSVNYAWDVDGDGVVDRRGSSSSVTLRYPAASSLQVAVSATDADGCIGTMSRALDVVGPVLTAFADAPQQVCGDNDAAIEPGERWKLPVTLRNDGGGALPLGGRALFARGTSVAAALATDDINDNGFGPLDDARTVQPIALPGGLRLFGQSFSQAFMSTNGYVSFNPAETGADYSNACGGGIDNGAAGPQLRPLHDDLKVSTENGAGLRYGFFDSCPRPAQSAPAAQACHVFQWSRMLWVNSDAVGEVSGDATFQAIVYQPSGQIVYQYLAADTHAGGQATIGVIGAAGADPLDVACNVPNAAPGGRAICLFDPAAPPSGGFPAGSVGPNGFGYRGFSNAAGACPYTPIELAQAQVNANTRIETPTLPLPALASAQEATLELPFAVSATAACGAALALDYIGSTAPGVSSLAIEPLLATTVGGGDNCQVSAACPAQIPVIATRPGFYYNGLRSGNGLANFIYGNVYGGVWYSALPDRTPTWYILNGTYTDHLGVLPLLRFSNPAAPLGFAPQSQTVGQTWVAQVDADTLVHAWTLADGQDGIELLDATPLPFTNPNHSQTWYSTAESGWGLSIESLVTGPGSVLEFMVDYLYDSSGTARWVLGTGNSSSGGTIPLSAYQVHCPACPWFVDWGAEPQPAGSQSLQYTGPTSALFDSQITLPAPLTGSWNRSNLPLTTIGAPAPPGR